MQLASAGRDERSADLAHQPVVVVSQADPTADRSEVQRTMVGYTILVREAVTIPSTPRWSTACYTTARCAPPPGGPGSQPEQRSPTAFEPAQPVPKPPPSRITADQAMARPLTGDGPKSKSSSPSCFAGCR
ncbi:hypothetical protein [Demequina lutea]|uniref:Uncharacterized protein n=1 Tax=Demequina lutea TaxID=431489 RepID=A0A7Z0CIW8_9MICO|nr:hypothetical protein [Demequina lutea]NYI40318.1 hypothetical protein [Demequina lutea]